MDAADLFETLYPVGLLDGRGVGVVDMGVPLHGPSAQYAITLFEGLIGYPIDGGIGIVGMSEHFERLFRSALRSDLGFARDPARLERLIGESVDALPQLLRTNAVEGTVYIRPTLYHQGTGSVCLGPALEGDVHLAVYLQRWDGYLAAKPDGLRVMISPFAKAASPVAHLKCSANYGLAIPAKLDAKKMGYDEVLFRDERRRIAEASSQNLLVDLGDRVVTPSLAASGGRTPPILPGVTLRILRESVGPSTGVKIEEASMFAERFFDRDCLGIALCGTASEVRRVGHVAWPSERYDRTFSETSENVAALIEGYARLTRGEACREWLTIVPL